ncbi:MAG: hypothetical protein WC623_24020 [Pedobacter sp.]|uniref:hypothetical protein n=1 Tax=Pedobacter sp. TaxID=1411316 RepID=UPI0035674750
MPDEVKAERVDWKGRCLAAEAELVKSQESLVYFVKGKDEAKGMLFQLRDQLQKNCDELGR